MQADNIRRECGQQGALPAARYADQLRDNRQRITNCPVSLFLKSSSGKYYKKKGLLQSSLQVTRRPRFIVALSDRLFRTQRAVEEFTPRGGGGTISLLTAPVSLSRAGLL